MLHKVWVTVKYCAVVTHKFDSDVHKRSPVVNFSVKLLLKNTLREGKMFLIE